MTDQRRSELFVWAARVSAMLALVVSIGGFGWLLKGNLYVRDSVAEMAGIPNLAKQIESLSDNVAALHDAVVEMGLDQADRSSNAQIDRDQIVAKVEHLEKAVNADLDPAPSIRFLTAGNKVAGPDGTPQVRIGGWVRLTWSYVKVRDCGPASPANLVIDSAGVTAQLTDVSTLDSLGRGILSPVNPSQIISITYNAKIPENRGLVPGQAQVWVVLAYAEDKCPSVEPVESPRLSLNLLPP